MKKVMCFGTFDKLHPGHESYLGQAKEYGDYLVVVVARDERVRRLKGKIPSQIEELRIKNLGKLDITDRVILGNSENRFKVIEDEKPDVVCLGYDQEVDTERLKKIFKGEIVRLKPHKPDVYKTSKMN
jgi:FAD synthetase